MFNRIRRALTRTRARHLPTGRHHRPLTPIRPAAVHHGRCDWSTALKAPRGIRAAVLAGEDSTLVRPYVLASEEHELQRSASAPHAPYTRNWFAPAEAF